MNHPSNRGTALAVATLLLGAVACSSSPSYGTRPVASPATAAEGHRAVVVVRVARPWYAPRFLVRRKFHEVLPEYESLAPLESKYFTISDQGQFGGIYLWTGRGDAEAHFDGAWRARVREKRGVDADVLLLDAPFVIEGTAVPQGEREGTRSLAASTWASLVRWELLPDGAAAAAAAKLAIAPWSRDALVKAFVVTGPGEAGIVALWATRQAAERAATEPERLATGRLIGAQRSCATLFEAPLLVDRSLHDEHD